MSEGDAVPVVYVELELGRTGVIETYRLPEGTQLYTDLRALLGRPEVERLSVRQRGRFAPLETHPEREIG